MRCQETSGHPISFFLFFFVNSQNKTQQKKKTTTGQEAKTKAKRRKHAASGRKLVKRERETPHLTTPCRWYDEISVDVVVAQVLIAAAAIARLHLILAV